MGQDQQEADQFPRCAGAVVGGRGRGREGGKRGEEKGRKEKIVRRGPQSKRGNDRGNDRMRRTHREELGSLLPCCCCAGLKLGEGVDGGEGTHNG